MLLLNALETDTGTGGGTTDQVARDAAAQAQTEVDALEGVVQGLPEPFDLVPDTVSLTTPSLAPNAQHSAALTVGQVVALSKLTVSQAARVRLYLSTAARSADASRVFGADFGAQSPYILFDAQLPHLGSLSLPLGLTASSQATDGVVYLLLENLGATGPITLTLNRLVLEPEMVA